MIRWFPPLSGTSEVVRFKVVRFRIFLSLLPSGHHGRISVATPLAEYMAGHMHLHLLCSMVAFAPFSRSNVDLLAWLLVYHAFVFLSCQTQQQI